MNAFDPALVERLLKLPEVNILGWFWLMQRRYPERLFLLQQMSAIVISRPADWNPAAIRAEHEQGGQSWSRARECYCCHSRNRLYRHHIIEVQHGGSNHQDNQVALCFACHKAIHPWLTDEPPPQPSRFGFEPIRSIAPRALANIDQILAVEDH